MIIEEHLSPSISRPPIIIFSYYNRQLFIVNNNVRTLFCKKIFCTFIIAECFIIVSNLITPDWIHVYQFIFIFKRINPFSIPSHNFMFTIVTCVISIPCIIQEIELPPVVGLGNTLTHINEEGCIEVSAFCPSCEFGYCTEISCDFGLTALIIKPLSLPFLSQLVVIPPLPMPAFQLCPYPIPIFSIDPFPCTCCFIIFIMPTSTICVNIVFVNTVGPITLLRHVKCLEK